MKISATLVKKVNRIFHEEEAKLYDDRHPEIEKDRDYWNLVLGKHLPQCRKGLKALDIGTGTGFVPSIIDRHLKDSLMVCIDISKEMLLMAKAKLVRSENHFEFIVCDAEKLPFKDDSVNIVTINSTLHHIPDYGSTLAETERILCEDGRVFIMHEPNRLFYQSLLSKVNRLCQSYLILKARFKRRQTRRAERNTLFEDVNRKLIDEGVITEPLSPRQIQTLVDVHSPTASGEPDRDKGFVPKGIVSQFHDMRVLEMETYNYLGKIDPKSDLLCFLLNRLLAKIQRGKGYSFYLVLGRIRI